MKFITVCLTLLLSSSIFSKDYTILVASGLNSKVVNDYKSFILKGYKAINQKVRFVDMPIKRMLLEFKENDYDAIIFSIEKGIDRELATPVQGTALSFDLVKLCHISHCDNIKKINPADQKGVSIRGALFLNLLPKEELDKLKLVDNRFQLLKMPEVGRVDYALIPYLKGFVSYEQFKPLDDFQLNITIYHWVHNKNQKVIKGLNSYFKKNPIKVE